MAALKINVSAPVHTRLKTQAKKHGFRDLTLQKLIQMRQLGILDSKADI